MCERHTTFVLVITACNKTSHTLLEIHSECMCDCVHNHYQLKSKIGNILNSANLSSINLVSIFRCSSHPHNPVYVKCGDPSDLSFSLSSHRHSYISLLFNSHFIDLFTCSQVEIQFVWKTCPHGSHLADMSMNDFSQVMELASPVVTTTST
jgi:hypothetical protein